MSWARTGRSRGRRHRHGEIAGQDPVELRRKALAQRRLRTEAELALSEAAVARGARRLADAAGLAVEQDRPAEQLGDQVERVAELDGLAAAQVVDAARRAVQRGGDGALDDVADVREVADLAARPEQGQRLIG